MSETAAPNPSRRPLLIRLALGIAALIALFALGRAAGDYVPRFASFVEGLGAWGPIVFIVAYAAATPAFVPGALLTSASGAIFGVVEGTIYSFTAALLGSTAAFLVARYVARGWVEGLIEGDRRFDAIDSAVAREGRKIVFLLRLTPVVPFNVLNYALGLTRVSLRDYLFAAPGMLPGTLLYVYAGKLVGDVAAAAGGAAPEKDAAYWALIGLGFVATVAVTVLVTRIGRRALARETELGGVSDRAATP